jgi:hypothetical protein
VELIHDSYKGTVASKNIQEGEVIAAVPLSLTYDLPPPEGYQISEEDRHKLTIINLQYQVSNPASYFKVYQDLAESKRL